MPVSSAPQTQYSRQTAIAVENSRVVLDRSSVTINASKQSLRSMHLALRKSIDAIAASQDAISQQAGRHTGRNDANSKWPAAVPIVGLPPAL